MKQYNLLKKITAVATTATMLLSTLPFTAFAVEDNTDIYEGTEITTEQNTEAHIINAYSYMYKGITIETSNPRHIRAIALSAPEFAPLAYNYGYEDYEYFLGFEEDYIQEMFNIFIYEESPEFLTDLENGKYNGYTEQELEQVAHRFIETIKTDKKVKVSIPFDKKDIHIININNIYAPYEVETEYIDGKYVFEADELGYFVLSSQPLPEYKEPELTQQTITDEYTGITVSGLLPTNANPEFDVRFFSSLYYSDINDSDHEAESLNDSRYAIPKADKLLTIVNSEEHPLPENEEWNQFTDEHSVQVQILFRDGLRLLDFSSDLTVTLPHGFNHLLEKDKNLLAYKANFSQNIVNPVQILPIKGDNTLSFKANSTGAYFLGINENLQYVLMDAKASIDKTMATAPALSDTDKAETTQVSASTNAPVSSNAIIIIIAGGVLLIAVVAVVIVLVKRKNN